MKDNVGILNKLLGFKATGNEQDWAIEFADANRIDEFINVIKNEDLSSQLKQYMVALILASYDDLLNENEGDDKNDSQWLRIKSILDKDKYNDILTYWALINENNKDYLYTITPLIKGYLKGE